jgi:streptogramin lyase
VGQPSAYFIVTLDVDPLRSFFFRSFGHEPLTHFPRSFMKFHISPREIVVVLGLGASLVLSGCGAGGSAPSSGSSSGNGSSGPAPTTTLTGTVQGGQHPVVGATVNLYAAGTSGYGTGAVSLLNGSAPVTTDSTGKFSMTNSIACPSPTTQIYLVTKGGNAGAGDNSSTVLMSAIGSCSKIGSGLVANVNEVSTVASVFALAQFMTPGSTSIGASSTNVAGMANAFATAANLADASGTARATTIAGNGTVPQTTINALANIVTACVATKGDGVCPQFFSLATPTGAASTPSDTLSALLDIALNPGNNVADLFALQPSTQVFQPSLIGAPSDWTLSIEYTGGGLNLPQLPAIDASGDIWVPNAAYPGTLSEFSPIGEPLSGTAGFSGGGLSDPEAVAVDLAGNIWTANYGNGTVSEYSSNGSPLSAATGYTAPGLNSPVALAIDAAGNVFIANSNNSVTKLNSSGAAIAQFTNGNLDVPYAVAIDPSQNVWIANRGVSNSVSKFSNGGTPASTSAYTGGGISTPFGIAIDATGNAWIANFASPSISELSSTGAPLSGSGYPTPAPVSDIAVDGSNTLWTANTDGSISHFSSSGAALSPPTGYISPGATAEIGIAIDASGNIWTTDNYVHHSIFEYVGAASPTITPLQLAVKNKTIGQRP